MIRSVLALVAISLVISFVGTLLGSRDGYLNRLVGWSLILAGSGVFLVAGLLLIGRL